MRYAMKRDFNEGLICEYLEVHGYRCWRVNGCPFDLVVYRDDTPAFLLIECKNKAGRNRATGQQTEFEATFIGRKPYATIRTPAEALEAARQWL